MPHSTKNSSETQRTFDLGDDGLDEGQQSRPMTSHSASTKRASGSYGVALTSTPSHDERTRLPSQQGHRGDNPNAWKRASAPDQNAYAAAIAADMSSLDATSNLDEVLSLRRAGDRNSMRSSSWNEASKRRTQYYEEQFQENAVPHSKARVQRQSPVIAELKTNVIIKDEWRLVTDLSAHLAQRYSRPESCIMIKVDHSACLALGGNFEPCYILTLHAVPMQTGPTTNKRNAALVQHFMADILSVPSERGVVTFIPIPEENLAMNGQTMLGEMEKSRAEESGPVKSALKDAARKSIPFAKKSNPTLEAEPRSNGNLTSSSTPSEVETASAAERPSTAQGPYAAENGLRMNPISNDPNLVGKNSRTPNGRPKSYGAQPSSTSRSIQEQMKREPIPHVSRQSMQQPKPASQQPQPQRSSLQQNGVRNSQANTPLAPRPVNLQTQPSSSTIASITRVSSPSKHDSRASSTLPAMSEIRTKNTYLDNSNSLTSKKESSVPIVIKDADSKTIDPDDPSGGRSIKDAANTAKRRSTITATPKLPSGGSIPKPPPVPEDTKSMNSKLGKRKSFLRMFKRNSVPAWYEQ